MIRIHSGQESERDGELRRMHLPRRATYETRRVPIYRYARSRPWKSETIRANCSIGGHIPRIIITNLSPFLVSGRLCYQAERDIYAYTWGYRRQHGVRPRPILVLDPPKTRSRPSRFRERHGRRIVHSLLAGAQGRDLPLRGESLSRDHGREILSRFGY